MAYLILLLVLFLVTRKAHRGYQQLRAAPKRRTLLPLIIVAVLVGLAVAGRR